MPNEVLDKLLADFDKELDQYMAEWEDSLRSAGEDKSSTVKPSPFEKSLKSFCPTGEGGGIDPHCSPGEEMARRQESREKLIKEAEQRILERIPAYHKEDYANGIHSKAKWKQIIRRYSEGIEGGPGGRERLGAITDELIKNPTPALMAKPASYKKSFNGYRIKSIPQKGKSKITQEKEHVIAQILKAIFGKEQLDKLIGKKDSKSLLYYVKDVGAAL